MELKEELTKADIQSILRTSKLLGDVSNDFKTYHFQIVDQLENDEDAEAEQETLDQHELKVMELIDRIAELVGEPSQTKEGSETVKNPGDADEATMKGQVVDRQLDILDGSVTAIKRSVETESVDVHILNNYLEKIKSLEGKLEVLEKEIVSLVDFRGRLERASHIERTLFDLRVHISRLTGRRRRILKKWSERRW